MLSLPWEDVFTVEETAIVHGDDVGGKEDDKEDEFGMDWEEEEAEEEGDVGMCGEEDDDDE